MINTLVHSSSLVGRQLEYRAGPAARASRDRVAGDQHAANVGAPAVPNRVLTQNDAV